MSHNRMNLGPGLNALSASLSGAIGRPNGPHPGGMEIPPELDLFPDDKAMKTICFKLSVCGEIVFQIIRHTSVRAGRGNALTLFRHLGPAFFLPIEPEQGQRSETVEQQHRLVENSVGAVPKRIGDPLQPAWIPRPGAVRLGIGWPRCRILFSPEMGVAFNFPLQGGGQNLLARARGANL